MQALLQGIAVLVHGLYDLIIRLLPSLSRYGQSVLHTSDFLKYETAEFFRAWITPFLSSLEPIDFILQLIESLLQGCKSMVELSRFGTFHFSKTPEKRCITLDPRFPIQVHLIAEPANFLD